MSGSPKYSRAELAEAVHAQIRQRQERQRREREERQRRQEEKERRRQLKAARRAVLERIALTETGVKAHLATSYASWAPSLHTLANFGELDRATRNAETVEAIDALHSGLLVVQEEVRRVVAEAQDAELAERLRQEQEKRRTKACHVRTSVAQRISGLDRQTSLKFDRQGFERVEAALGRIHELLKEERFDEVDAVSQTAFRLVREHSAAVSSAQDEWLRQRRHAHALLGEAEALFSSACDDDGPVARWCGPRLDSLRSQLRTCKVRVGNEEWATAIAGLKQVRQSLLVVIKDAEECEIEEAKRRYIVASIEQVLHAQGFYTDAPRLLNTNPDSDVIIHADRSDRRSLDIGIPVRGDIRYQVDEECRYIKREPDGTITARCPEAEQAIESLHRQLDRDFGVLMGDLYWEGKPPTSGQAELGRSPCSTTATVSNVR